MNYLLSIKRTGASEFINLGDDERAAREDFALLACQFSLDGYIVSVTGDRATAYTRDLTDVVTLHLLREGADGAALAMRDYEAAAVRYAGTSRIPGQVIFPTGDETTEVDEVQHG